METQTTVEINHHVSFAHRLKNDPGACKNLHGHTWIITAQVSGRVQEITGMIVDFWALKKAIKTWLDWEYDHSCVLQEWDPFIPMIESEGGRIVILGQPPTTEVLAARMMRDIQDILDKNFTDLRVIELRLQETPSNAVTVRVK
jgi:6-pyruvoyltetrahydropterin/6-carboxytetrahydropterin synthase